MDGDIRYLDGEVHCSIRSGGADNEGEAEEEGVPFL